MKKPDDDRNLFLLAVVTRSCFIRKIQQRRKLHAKPLPRALVYIQAGQEWVGKQLAARVLVAVSDALGEKSHDLSASGWKRANAEIARRLAHRPPAFAAEIVGYFEIIDRSRPYVVVGVYRGREQECQDVANCVVATVARILRRPAQVHAYEAYA